MKKQLAYKLICLFAVVLLLTAMLAACQGCKHEFADGACKLCGEKDPGYVPPCNHTFSDGACTSCGESDPNYIPPCEHSYTDGVCSKCGTLCAHSYINGVCIKCIKICTHSFTDGVCAECETVCLHSYSQGACVTCGIPCRHVFVDSVCAKCEIVCTHYFFEGACVHCAAVDEDYIPADGGREYYNKVVEKYQYLVLYKYMNEELPPRGTDEPPFVDVLYEVVAQFQPYNKFGYTYMDLDSDGYVELLLTESTKSLYAIFTLVDKTPTPVAAFQQGMGYLGQNGLVLFNTKEFDSNGGQIFLGYHITRLEGGRLVGISYGWEDSDADYATQGDDVHYIVDGDGNKSSLTYEEYKEIRDYYSYYWENPTRLTKLNNLTYNPALTTSLVTTLVADYSSYDAIIKTFGLMLSEAAGGKFTRSKWIAGDYDEGMRFNSEADFVIYNRIFAACALVPSSNAKFGFARADLNKDGIQELILLDSNYAVLAIFTELDGSPALLDSYTDVRRAFIDADGRIHVKVGIIEGNESNSEYFVYEINGTELKCLTAIGVEYDSSDLVERYYKLENGTAVDVEKTDWDALYAEYALDMGEADMESYTKENAGLTFAEAVTD